MIYLPKYRRTNLKKISHVVREFLKHIRQKIHMFFLRLYCNTLVTALGSLTMQCNLNLRIKVLRFLVFDLIYKLVETCVALMGLFGLKDCENIGIGKTRE